MASYDDYFANQQGLLTGLNPVKVDTSPYWSFGAPRTNSAGLFEIGPQSNSSIVDRVMGQQPAQPSIEDQIRQFYEGGGNGNGAPTSNLSDGQWGALKDLRDMYGWDNPVDQTGLASFLGFLSGSPVTGYNLGVEHMNNLNNLTSMTDMQKALNDDEQAMRDMVAAGGMGIGYSDGNGGADRAADRDRDHGNSGSAPGGGA